MDPSRFNAGWGNRLGGVPVSGSSPEPAELGFAAGYASDERGGSIALRPVRRPNTSGVLQQRLVEAAEKVERVLHDTHDAYARLEAQDTRLLPLQGMLESQCDNFSESRLDQFRRFIADLRSQQQNQGDLRRAAPPAQPAEPSTSSRSPSPRPAVGTPRTLSPREAAASAARATSPSPISGTSRQSGGQAFSDSKSLDPSVRLEIIGSIEVLEQEMAQLNELAVCGESAAGEVAGVRRDLESLWEDMGSQRLRQPGFRALPAGPSKDEGALSQELRVLLGDLRAQVSQLTARCDRRDADAVETEHNFSRMKQALVSLYHSSRASAEGSPSGRGISASPASDSSRLAEEVREEVSLVRQELAMLKGEMRGKALSHPSSPRFLSAGLGAESARSRSPASARNSDLADEVQSLRHELEDIRAGLKQLASRCERASEEAVGARHDLDSLREDFAAASPARKPLASASEPFATRREHAELRHQVETVLSRTDTLTQQELDDALKALKAEIAPINNAPKQDLAEVEELVRREFGRLTEQQRENGETPQALTRKTEALMEELKEVAEKGSQNEKACAEVASFKKSIERLWETVNIMKDERERSEEKTKETIEAVEHEVSGLRKNLDGVAFQPRQASPSFESLRNEEAAKREREDLQIQVSELEEQLKNAAFVTGEQLKEAVAKAVKQKTQEEQVHENGEDGSGEGRGLRKAANADDSQEVSMDEFKGAIDVMMDEIVKVGGKQKSAEDEIRDTQRDVEKLVEGLQVLKLRNGKLGEDLKTLMDDLNERVQGFQEELRDALEEMRAGSSASSPATSPNRAVGNAEAAVSTLKQELQDTVDAIRKEIEGLKNQMSSETSSSNQQDLAAAVKAMSRELAEVKEQASLGADVDREISEVNAQLRQELSVLVERAHGSEDHTDDFSRLRADVEALQQSVKKDAAEVAKQLKAEVDTMRFDVAQLEMVAEKGGKAGEIVHRTSRALNDLRDDIEKLKTSPPQSLQAPGLLGAGAEETLEKVREDFAASLDERHEAFNFELARLAGSMVTRQATSSCRSAQDSRQAIKDAALARRECEQLRVEMTTLTARLIAERSMVAAGVAAAMSIVDRSAMSQQAATPGELADKRYPRLRVTIVSARGLQGQSGAEAVSPFCECSSQTRRSWSNKTEVIANSIAPSWGHTFETQAYVIGDTLEFNVWDREAVDGQLLGTASLPASRFFPDGFQGELPLDKIDEKQIYVRVEFLGEPSPAGPRESGSWKYLVLAQEGVCVRRALSFEKEANPPPRLQEGDLVNVVERCRSPGAIFLRLAEEPGGWVFCLEHGGLDNRIVEASVEDGLWTATVAVPGLRPLSHCSMRAEGAELKNAETLDEGKIIEVTQRIVAGSTTFLRLRSMSGWLADRFEGTSRGGLNVTNIEDALEPPREVIATEDADDAKLGMTPGNMPPGLVYVLRVAEGGWASRCEITPGSVILEVKGQPTLKMESQVFKGFLLERPVTLKVRTRRPFTVAAEDVESSETGRRLSTLSWL